MKNSVVIYRSDLVALTERFVLAQGEGLTRYTPYYLGVRRVPGLEPPKDRTFIVEAQGRLRVLAFKVFGQLGALSAELERRHPVLVHAHFGNEGLRIMPWAKRHRLPLLVTFHGYDALIDDKYARKSHYSHRQYAKHKHQLARYASRCLTVSRFVQKRLLERGFPEERCQVHYIGVDLEQFVPDPTIARERVVLFVGRLVESKGCEFLIEAMRDVQQHVADARLVIIGDGALRARLETAAKRSLRNVEFTGSLPPAEVRHWMCRASVLSVPSVPMPDGYAEAFGLVFAEAQAIGTPVVTFATGGIPEVVADGETGFLVPPRDVTSLAAKLVAVLQDHQCWQRFSAAAIQRMRDRFDLRAQNQALERIYDVVSARVT